MQQQHSILKKQNTLLETSPNQQASHTPPIGFYHNSNTRSTEKQTLKESIRVSNSKIGIFFIQFKHIFIFISCHY